jgi:transcriptional regulator with XRE-family HTH domain
MTPRSPVDPAFAERLRHLREERGLSLRALGTLVLHAKSYLHDLETGRRQPSAALAGRLDQALDAAGELATMVHQSAQPADVDTDDEIAALDLARRVTASDVSNETLERLERAADDLAIAYTSVPPAELLSRARKLLRYVRQLLDERATLTQHRQLLVTGGWLSLMTATLHIDLGNRDAADANLKTAAQLAGHAGHPEIEAWCLETRAWEVLTMGDYEQAVELSQHAQAIAPKGSSALIQATAQEGRAWARMVRTAETRDALTRMDRLVSPLPVPERPEHHYHYDPGKALSYTATTLAWIGDPAAEEHARAVVTELEAMNGKARRPRRIASARLDLGLALVHLDRPDEAGEAAREAITSGRVVPSNWWRATEVMSAVERAGVPEARELRQVYEEFRPT